MKQYNINLMFTDRSVKEYRQVIKYELATDGLVLELASGSMVVIFKSVLNGFSVEEVK